jgi:hypothetical protein
MSFETQFDAAVERYVLEFLPDPWAAVEKEASYPRPGVVRPRLGRQKGHGASFVTRNIVEHCIERHSIERCCA